MPNWCFTQMIFHGEKEEIKDFHRKIEEWTSKNYQENGFGVNWLGNVVHGAGLGNQIDATPSVLRCRGDITYLGDIDTFGDDSEEAAFNLDTETAWCPMTSMWSEVIKVQNYKTIGFSYCAEEPGCEIYEIYDPYGDFTDRYYIDVFVEGDDLNNKELEQILECREYVDDDELREALQAFLNTDEQNLKTLIQQAENYKFKNEDSYLYIHEYVFVDSPTG